MGFTFGQAETDAQNLIDQLHEFRELLGGRIPVTSSFRILRNTRSAVNEFQRELDENAGKLVVHATRAMTEAGEKFLPGGTEFLPGGTAATDGS